MIARDPLDLAVFRAKVFAHRTLRWIDDRRAPLQPARRSRLLVDRPVVAEDASPLWNRESSPGVALDPREWPLEWGKVENLRVAARHLDGLEFEAGQPFSFWAQVGPPLPVRGFVPGRELREGCVVPGIGGGLCLLSNALYAVAVSAGCSVLERHPHSVRPPGSRAALGEDATVAWNYVDLRFVAPSPWRLEVELDAEQLWVRIRSERRSERSTRSSSMSMSRSITIVGERRRGSSWSGDAAPSCMACDQPCDAARPPRTRSDVAAGIGRRTWLVDAVWPEYAGYLREHAGPGDRLAMAIDGQLLRSDRYAWPRVPKTTRIQFPGRTLLRSLRSRQLGDQGAARQRALLAEDRRLAAAMAATLEAHDTELVVAQSLVPHLARLGVLGGRRVTVLMQRLPLAELQARLDQAHARWPASPTLADFRADPQLVADEARALAMATAIVTPHAEIAALFPDQAVELDWVMPSVRAANPGGVGRRIQSRAAGPLRLWLPASSVGRKGAWELRAALSGTGPTQLWVSGRELERDPRPGAERFWPPELELVHAAAQLEDIDAVVLPAWVEHQPRALLRAVAAGVPVIASAACGLARVPGVRTVATGEVAPLRAAIEQLRAGLVDPRGADVRAQA